MEKLSKSKATETVEQIKTLVDKDAAGQFTPDNQNEMLGLYKSIFGSEACNTCSPALKLKKLAALTADKLVEMSNREYMLKPDTLFTVGPDDYTNENITDEIARNILRSHPGAIDAFSTYPENWQQDVNQQEPAGDGEPSLVITSPDGTVRTQGRWIKAGDTAKIGEEPAPDGQVTVWGYVVTIVSGVVTTSEKV